ncbi:unnamed protein product [Spirodela intermedia]|uniref:Uncharacterized protein n=1 Tax=Spirodela intermedia TaxID=51605 RepID=A0A7I8J350_SPIIN|nr:unnamed protein product [Spirodela intermedia]CAA6664233.1 unnamed protein product [Spirodela intermedia]
MERGGASSTDRLVALGLTALAVASPLYVGRSPAGGEAEEEREEGSSRGCCRHCCCLLDGRRGRFDPYWIHRFGGSSGGILSLLFLLAFVLKCKTTLAS